MTTQQERAWSALASTWDTATAGWTQPIADRLIELAGLKRGMVTADMGCGAGAVTLPAARVVHPARVIAVDSSAAMIARAEHRAREAGIENVVFRCVDATRPGLEQGAFDAVISSLVVTFFPSPAMALHAWRDLLRPGGVIAFSWMLSEDRAWQPAYDAVDAFLAREERWSATRPHWAVADAEAALPPDMSVATRVEDHVTRYASVSQWWELSLTQAPAIAWSHIPAESRDNAREAAFARLRRLQKTDGSLERVRTICYTVASLPG
jgi:SAM-dependent methyltransferase